MKKILLIITLLFSVEHIFSQETGSLTWFGSTSVTEQDSLLVISTFGDPISGLSEQNGIIANTDPYPYILFSGLQTGTRELPLIEGLQVYPNPSTEMVFLQRNATDQNLVVNISGLNGIVLLEKMWAPGDQILQLHLKDLVKGIYTLSVVNDEKTTGSRFKLVKL